jgi:class 3 adenylate cyclase/tetratricopeptide (TPR) repeat protein
LQLQCVTCGAENRAGRRFCGQCGAALPSACAACGFANDPGEKFCGGCGAPLAAVAAAAAVPAAAAEPEPQRRPEVAPEPTEATRRQLTVMFCDLVGSTALSERLDPEELSDLLAAYQDTCARVIARYEGHIGRYVGDALLVYFGYPKAHEDDAQRAVWTALGIVEAIAALNVELGRSDLELAVRIGIATGLVVVGDIGTGERRERAAIVGETPNLAARLQGIAPPNGIVIAAATERLVEGLFVCDDLGPQVLKGISQPVTAYRVREASGARSRFEAKARHGLAAIVGREEETALLDRRWQQSTEGEGQIVLISGEAGLGKSRIMQALKERAGEESRSRILYYCSPYHRDTPFHPVIEQFERGLRFERRDSLDQKLDKLEAVLAQLGIPVQPFAPLFAAFLSLRGAARYGPLGWNPEDTKKKTLEALVAVIEAMAVRQPVLMVVEDLHWADPSTLEMLNLLVERIPRARMLLLATSRPEFDPPWGDRPHISHVRLRRMNRKESAALIAQVAGGKPLPDEVLQQIVERTDGVPLFIEELTKTALESGAFEDRGDRWSVAGPLPALAIPASLQESLMARLDRLAPVKEVAQVAAALGRTFTRDLLAQVSRMAESALESALEKLVDAELVYRRGIPPDAVYEFKHALVQDVAYSSLLRNKRQQLHEEIAGALVRQYPDMVETHPELVAHHYREAGLPVHAIPYALRAGDLAAARFARAEATAHYESAHAMARALPPTDDAARAEIRAVLKLAAVASNRAQFERDLENLARARSLAERIGDQELLCRVLYWIGRVNYVFGRFDAGIDYAAQSLRIAETLGGKDPITAEPVNLLARLHCLTGEPKQAVPYAERSLEQMARLGNRVEEAAVAGVLSFAYGLHGRFAQAFEAAERGVSVARATEHLPTLAACLMFRAVARGWHGELERAREDFDEAIDVSARSGDLFRRYLSHGFRGEAHLVAGEPERAAEDLDRCLALGEQIGTAFHLAAFKAFRAEVCLAAGEAERAQERVEKALEGSTEKAHDWSRSIALRVHAEALLALEPPALERAAASLRTAIAIQQSRECRCDLAWSHLALGRLKARQGDADGARAAIAAAGEMFREMGIASGMLRARQTAAAIDGAPGESPSQDGMRAA